MNYDSNGLRVLSIDGGGMRGLYTASYLAALSKRYEVTRGLETECLDIGKGFGLIAASSTGAIIGCCLAAGVPLEKVSRLYCDYGRRIFPAKLPHRAGFGLVYQSLLRKRHNKAGAVALKEALESVLGDRTVSSIWNERRIALAIPAVEMSTHKAWVFKTPHLGNSRHRDDAYRLVDVCLAATAAPIYRSMALLDNPDTDGKHVFVDGGLWANNPVLIGLIDALQLTQPTDRIEIYCLGTCPRPEGDLISPSNLDRGPVGWRFGGEVATVSIAAQEHAYDNMARILGQNVNRECRIIRFPHGSVSANLMRYLDLDETDPAAMAALVSQAHTDVSATLARSGDPNDADGKLLHELFMQIPTTMAAKIPSPAHGIRGN